jgi:very-short-patch-repair endonuclease
MYDKAIHNDNVLRNRIRQIFTFLRALIQQRFPASRQIRDRSFVLPLNQLPDHESVRVFFPAEGHEDHLLYVKRPKLIPCPNPPENIMDWLEKGWDNCFQLPEVREKMPTGGNKENIPDFESYDEDSDRVANFEYWISIRTPWAEERKRAEQALQLFDSLYQQFALLEKEGGQVELLVGDGLLNWRLSTGGIHHPILLKKVELKFDSTTPAFSVIDSDRPSEIYNSLLMNVDDVDIKRLQERSKELTESQYHPLGGTDTSAFLKVLVQSLSPTNGEFLNSPTTGERDHPRIWREPFLFCSQRNMSYGIAIDRILQDIEKNSCFPRSLAAIAGIYNSNRYEDHKSGPIPELDSKASQKEGVNILLAKAANAAQINIIRRFHQTGLVHVQGPPGTGKTYTIGNIIGHLLAQGKRILITSHTEKALRVLKDAVPLPLQSLCVSVLSDDSESRKQLEDTINAINHRLTRCDADDMLKCAQKLNLERESLLIQEKNLRGRLRGILDAEYNLIEIDGHSLEPSAASREVAITRKGNDWIPGSVKINAPFPLTDEELALLYASNGQLTTHDEADLKAGLPNINHILTPDIFALLISDYCALHVKDLRAHEEYWTNPNGQYNSLKISAEQLFNDFDQRHIKQTWQPSAIIAGKLGGQNRLLWETLCQRIEHATDLAHQLTLIEHLQPSLKNNIDCEDSLEICRQIQTHLSSGGKLGMITLLMRSDWKRFIQLTRVVSGEPHRKEHFEALALELELNIARRKLSHLWNNLIANQGGTIFAELGTHPESACKAIIPEIRRCLDWYNKFWSTTILLLFQEGLNWQLLESRVSRQESPLADYIQIEEIVVQHLPDIVCSELSRRKMRDIEKELTRNIDFFKDPVQGIGSQFLQSIHKRNPLGYKQAYARLVDLLRLKPIYEERQLILQKIHALTPRWAEAIRNRVFPHNQTNPPGDFITSWRWLRLSSELKRRQEEDSLNLQHALHECQNKIQQVTVELIESLAWGRQIKKVRSKPELQQSLSGWLELQKRILSTRIKSVLLKLKIAAQRELKTSSDAVPVWIMPLHAISENFDPVTTKFDVVIIDEASQANLMAMIPLYMADQAIIVGDHEQTTPEAIGVAQQPIQNLIDAHLQGIPNSELFDLLTSIYDIARRCFGETVMLTEHFRCVPDIIEFSNKLSYEGKILPLREESSSTLKPSTIAYQVKGIAYKKQNEAEADAIVRLVIAMTIHPAYKEATIGVITLLGEEQARLIDTKLRAEIPASEYLKRRIVCGNASQFQGDERDVIFISLVDSMGDEEHSFLRKKGEGAFGGNKKRFNVAASRAKEQLWVVHSMDPQSHLKPDDIRRELILHAQNPQMARQGISSEIAKADSIFEIRVMEMLAQKGYRVKAQWKVGYHRIDLVVVGETKRLAIECDGDRWHPPSKRDEDLERQAILERIGWKFVRIRGSCFFLDPLAAMQPIFEKLQGLGIERLGPENNPQNTADHTLVYELERLAWPERLNETDCRASSIADH